MPWLPLSTPSGLIRETTNAVRLSTTNSFGAVTSVAANRRVRKRSVHTNVSPPTDKPHLLPLPGQRGSPQYERPEHRNPSVRRENIRHRIHKHDVIPDPPPRGWIERSSQDDDDDGGGGGGRTSQRSTAQQAWTAQPPAPGTIFRFIAPAAQAQRYVWQMSHVPGLAAGHGAPEAAWRTRLMMAVSRATKDYEDHIPVGVTATYLGLPADFNPEGSTYAYPSKKEWTRETLHKPAFTHWPQTLVTESGEWKIRVHSPTAQWWIKRGAGVTHSSLLTDSTFNGRISMKHIFFIAQVKLSDLDPPPRPPRTYCGFDLCSSDTPPSQQLFQHYLSDPPIVPEGTPAVSEAEEYDELMQHMCALLCQMARRMGIHVVT